ncbi:MAG TPA: hypothetical protein VLI69_03530 [Gammaproteobacteria bacterium]|nr:hypothetical protein [Gammaproteobacteria bacterium]
MKEHKELKNVRERRSAIQKKLTESAARLTPLQQPLSAEEILEALELKEAGQFFSAEILAKNIAAYQKLKVTQEQAKILAKNALEISEKFAETDRDMFLHLETDFGPDETKIAALQLFDAEHKQDLEIYSQLQKALQHLKNEDPAIKKNFDDFLQKPINKTEKMSDYFVLHDKKVVNKGFLFSSTSHEYSLHFSENAKLLETRVTGYPQKVRDIQNAHAAAIELLNENTNRQEKEEAFFESQIAACEKNFSESKKHIIDYFAKSKILVERIAEKNNLALEEIDKINTEKKAISEKITAASIGYTSIKNADSDLKTLKDVSREMAVNISEIEQSIFLRNTAAESAFRALNKATKLRKAAIRAFGEATRWSELMTETKNAGLLFKALDLESQNASLEQLRLDKEALDQRIQQMSAAEIKPVPQVDVLAKKPAADIAPEPGTDEEAIARYRFEALSYFLYLKEEVDRLLKNFAEECIDQPFDKNKFHQLADILGCEKKVPAVLASLTDLYDYKNNKDNKDNKDQKRRRLAAGILVHSGQEILKDTLCKYRVFTNLLIEHKGSASQQKEIFLNKLRKPENQKIFGKRRDKFFMDFAKACGMTVAVILGVATAGALAYHVTYKTYLNFYGKNSTRALQVANSIEEHALEMKKFSPRKVGG